MSDLAFGVDPAYVDASGTGGKVARRVLMLIGLVAALNLAAALLAQWLDPQTDGPFGSSYVTTDQGVGAFHDVLTELGRPVDQLRVPFSPADVPADATVIVVDPDVDAFDVAYGNAMLSHVQRGGRVLLVGVPNAARLFDLEFDLVSSAAARLDVPPDAPWTSGVASISTEAGERLVDLDGEVLVGDDLGAIIARWEFGSGDLILVSDPWIFTNEWIGKDDNSVLAVRLAGGGSVVFDEYVHGFGTGQGIQGIGAALVRIGIVGVLAALVAMWAVGKRIGPAEQTERALPPPRAAYLDAMAITVAKARDESAFTRLHGRAVHHLKRIGRRYVGLSESAQQERAAADLGLDDDDLALLTRPALSTGDVRELAAVAAKIERAKERNRRWTS